MKHYAACQYAPRVAASSCRSILCMYYLVFFNNFETAFISASSSSRTIAASPALAAIRHMRGGVSNSSPYDLNPNYVPSARQQSNNNNNNIGRPNNNIHAMTLGDLDGGTPMSNPQQQIYQNSFGNPTSGQQRSSSTTTYQSSIKAYIERIHRTSPTLSIGSLVCIVVYILWQIPISAIRSSLLRQHFLCNLQNLKSRPHSLLLSAASHEAPMHLIFNLMAFLSLGPKLRVAFAQTSWPALWPLVMGAGVAGNVSFLLRSSRGGSCMGLSGVTMAFLAVLAKLFPDAELGMVVGVIPVRVPSHVALKALLAISVLGFINPSSRVAHSAHLGGLLFGMAYYESWTRRQQFQRWWKQMLAPWRRNGLSTSSSRRKRN